MQTVHCLDANRLQKTGAKVNHAGSVGTRNTFSWRSSLHTVLLWYP